MHKKRVLLIEAGGPSIAAVGGKDFVMPPPLSCEDPTKKECNMGLTWFEVPNYYPMFQTKYYWKNPPPYRAKVLGGGSALNALGWYRRIPIDFEGWPIGWTYDDFLKYYKIIENVTAPDLTNSLLRGHGGLIQVSRNISIQFEKDQQDPFLKSALNFGIPYNPDFNAESRYGIGLYDVNVGNGLRSNTLSAYLAPVWDSPYLTVHLYAEVTKIIFDSSNTVQGVEYIDYITSKISIALTQKEVIVTAGAIGTPKLLQLSGIGNPDNLKNLGIPVVADVSSVGTNVRNHIGIYVTYSVKSGYNFQQLPFGQWDSYFQEYNLHRTGYFASVSSKHLDMFVSSKGDILNPDIQIEYGPGSQRVLFVVTLQWTETKGFVHLASKDPSVLPNVEYGRYLDPRDIDALLWGRNFVRDLVKVSPFSEIIDQEISPGANLTDQQIREWIFKNSHDWNHWTSSCALGDSTSPNAVVDTSLFVKGVHNVRVADASVLITAGNGNIQNSVMAVAEIASDLILGNR